MRVNNDYSVNGNVLQTLTQDVTIAGSALGMFFIKTFCCPNFE